MNYWYNIVPYASENVRNQNNSIRERVLNAAFSLFREHGFSSTSMLDIVTRARISKRDLYALFKNKHAVLATCISEHTEQMRRTLDTTIPVPQSRDALTKLLVEFGVSILKTSGREANLKAVTELIRNAQSLGLIVAGDPAVLAARFFAVLTGDLLIRLLMRVREAPTKRGIVARARAATEMLVPLRKRRASFSFS